MEPETFSLIGIVLGGGALTVAAAMIKGKAFVERELQELEPLVRTEVEILRSNDETRDTQQTADLSAALVQLTDIHYNPFSLFTAKGANDIINTCRRYGIAVDYNAEADRTDPTSGFFD